MQKAILFTSVGRRVEWIQMVREALNPDIKVIAADTDSLAPALQFADEWITLPKVSEIDFSGKLLDACQLHQISHVFPLIDTELSVYAGLKHEMSLFGVELIISDSFTVELTRDKFSFSLFLTEKGIATPRIISSLDEINSTLKYFIRPRFGSRSVDSRKIKANEASEFIKKRNWVVTEWHTGTEYSIDIIADGKGNCEIIVPRIRNLIRDGESMIGTTDDNEMVINASRKLISLLPGLYGPICLQGLLEEQDFYITELNARFGGGIILSEKSGAGITSWISSKVYQKSFNAPNWQNGKRMSRYLKGFYS